MIDLLAVPIVWFSVLMLFAAVWGFVIGAAGIAEEDEDPLFDRTFDVLMIVFLFGVPLLYHWLFEASRLQATPGKLLAGVRVTTADGARLGLGRALGRSFVRFVSSIALGVGFLPAVFTSRRQTLHDLLADTLVVPRSPQTSIRQAGSGSALPGPARTGRSAPA